MYSPFYLFLRYMQILFFPISLDTVMKNPDINNTYSNTYKYDDVHSYEAYKDLLLNDGKSIHDKNYDITYYYDRRDEEKEDPEDDEMNWDK